MGIVNVTPDSFSDGGQFLEPERAVDHALRLFDEGADLVDLGAESTRPGGGVYGSGAPPVSIEEECERLLPVLEELRRRTDGPISVDTRKAAVARQALDAGADLVNDVSGLGDPEMASTVADADCPLVLMHSRGETSSMQTDIHFRDLLGEVTAELETARDRALAAGVPRSQIVIDPGIGFGKTYRQNLSLLRFVSRFRELGHPILLGASRKSFIGHLTGAHVEDRLAGSLAALGWAANLGVDIVRVHDVAQTHQFLTVWAAIDAATPEGK